MLDLFSIFSKGGIVLWCCQGTSQSFTSSVNALIKSVILQERGGFDSFTHEALTLKYKLDNEFELVFVVAYQKFLQLSYVDKLLSDIQIEFRNKYKDDLQDGKLCRDFSDFTYVYQQLLREKEEESKMESKAPRAMRKFEDSDKSKKTVASMIESRKDEDLGKKPNKKKNKPEKAAVTPAPVTPPAAVKPTVSPSPSASKLSQASTDNGDIDEATLIENRNKLFNKAKKQPKSDKTETVKTPEAAANKKKSKEKREWDLSNKDKGVLDYSNEKDSDGTNGVIEVNIEERRLVGKMGGALRDLEPDSDSDDDEVQETTVTKSNNKSGSSGGLGFGLLSGLKNLVGSKTLTRQDIEPVMEKMRNHLIAKNVASEIAESLCDSVATKLEGKVVGTFKTISATVKQALTDACFQILTPRRRIDILRDAMESKQKRNPFVITFCGVNGVGKSTNLAKICFWLIENGLRVLIAACDTFRAGAVEQLRTHCRKLNALHPPDMHGGQQMVQLYEKGYGKDAAGIAMEAIHYARDHHIDVVLVDTAGRMQDNEPLMRALAKLIKVNQPDLVLFVGEALVGNEAVDQLVKFNQALADHSSVENPHLIDGIVLSKYDTIDDKVGAAISMTYTTGQPIVFVGTGQTYTDLKNLNARSVVHSLLKA